MSKKTLIYLSICLIAIIVAISIGGIIGKRNLNTGIKIPANVATYYCEEGAIVADYSSTSVALSLSDGRQMILSHTISADGARYEMNGKIFWNKGDNAFMTEGNKTTYSNCVAGIEKQIDSKEINYTDASKTFSFSFPDQFMLSGELGYSQDWQTESTSSGLLLAEIMIQKNFMPKTNFGESRFTIGVSSNPDAVKNCLVAEFPNMETKSIATINGVQFTKLHFTDAGAGNFYDTTSYRAIRNSQCYAIEYTIHSMNIYNYSPDQGVTAFDQAKVQNIFENMVHSFKFL